MIKKMIAVWGSNGSGKSAISLALASALANKKNNVVIINTSTTIPHLPIFIPTLTKTNSDNSIGSLFTEKDLNESKLKNKIAIHPQNDNIGIMALVSGENPFTYSDFLKENVFTFFNILNDTAFDYIIFDCESNPIYDAVTMMALDVADVKFQIVTPNIKGAEFLKTQASYLRQESKYTFDDMIRVISPVKENTPIALIDELLGGYQYALPFSKEVDNAFLSGTLIRGFNKKAGIKYINVINKIVKEQIE